MFRSFVTVVVVTLLVWTAATTAQQAAPAAALKIVVIKGEDAVNIIQQNTAVAPVIEVRDRNNLPVPGAVVTFSIGSGQGASFGAGLQTLTVATNAAGQATAAGLTPLATGTLQINAAAAFQGQVASITIAQTNVATAAQAAAAAAGTSGAGGAGSSAGAAAGSGGGLSGTTIGILGAVAGGAALVATQAAGGREPSAGGTGQSSATGTYTGSLTGQLSVPVTFVGRVNATCTSTRALSGTLALTLERVSTDAVAGQWQAKGPQTEIAQTGGAGCTPNPRQGLSIDLGGSVTGTPGSLSFNAQLTDTGISTEQSGARSTTTVTRAWSFSGVLSGGVITGTMTYSETIQGTAFDASGAVASTFSGSGTAMFSVSLRR